LKVIFTKTFKRDLKKLRNVPVWKQIGRTIVCVEQADKLLDVSSIKHIQGHEGFFRIRIGNYRLGMQVEDDVVIFMRALHRKEIYRRFP